MPHFFFDIHANGQVMADHEGMELPDFAAVRRKAMEALPSIVKDELSKDGDTQSYAVHVRDDAGKPVYTATLNFDGVQARPG